MIVATRSRLENGNHAFAGKELHPPARLLLQGLRVRAPVASVGSHALHLDIFQIRVCVPTACRFEQRLYCRRPRGQHDLSLELAGPLPHCGTDKLDLTLRVRVQPVVDLLVEELEALAGEITAHLSDDGIFFFVVPVYDGPLGPIVRAQLSVVFRGWGGYLRLARVPRMGTGYFSRMDLSTERV